MAAKKARKRAYIPPSSEVVNRRERTESTRTQRGSDMQRSTGRSARGAYEYPKPSLNRTLRRLPVYFLMIFALQYFLLGSDPKAPEGAEKLLLAGGTAAAVTLLFAPFMHMMDRMAYNRHQRRSVGTDKKS
jgi:hypothetical protein